MNHNHFSDRTAGVFYFCFAKLTVLSISCWFEFLCNFNMNLAGTLIYQNKNQNLDIDANHTCLCNHVWKLKSSTPPIPYNIVWDIVARAATYNPATGYCDLKRSTELCLNLKVHSLTREFFAYCYHQRPQLLINFKQENIIPKFSILKIYNTSKFLSKFTTHQNLLKIFNTFTPKFFTKQLFIYSFIYLSLCITNVSKKTSQKQYQNSNFQIGTLRYSFFFSPLLPAVFTCLW